MGQILTGNVFDSVNVPTAEPETVVAGDLVQWRRNDLADIYATSLYSMEFVARRAESADKIEIAATEDSDGYLFSAASTVTADWVPGQYYYDIFVTRTSDSARARLKSGIFTVEANRDVDTSDPRSHARIMLAKIESVIEGRADSDVDNYSIGGRSITKMSVDELTKWRSHYRGEVEAEDNAIRRKNGKPSRTYVQTRFSPW